jgi:hypothetical protein
MLSLSASRFCAATGSCWGAGKAAMKHLDANDAATSATFDFAQPARAADIDSEIAVVPRFDEEDFNALFESSAEALVMIDASGVIQKANGRGRELLR